MVVRGAFAKREASTPPETAVLVFRDARVRRGRGKRTGTTGVGIGHTRCERSYTRSRATRARRSGRRARWRSACRRVGDSPGGDSPGGDSPGSPTARGWPDEAPVAGWDPPEVSGYASRRVAGGTGATSSVMPTDLARAMFRVADAVRTTLDPRFDWQPSIVVGWGDGGEETGGGLDDRS